MSGTLYIVSGAVMLFLSIVFLVLFEWLLRRKKKEVEGMWRK